ncbi:glycosyltransferase [Thalassotalea fonticola]|uniref:Glycosyltransferase n=1 Tax=Thalassotalea fonticola TaxID=3065649 RepID=A0ABZ0GQ78_9GAMM|nr:glycosyltransferase [Colwelliaceae bacterium S1-1]
MQKTPTVSIIMATYNSSGYLMDTINSILEQSYTDWELLITDDCSNDGTYRMLSALTAEHENIHVWQNKKNSGAAISRNNSIVNAKGRYIAFLDSDDIWHNKKLELHLQYMQQHQAGLSFTSYELIDENSAPLQKIVDKQDLGWVDYQNLLKKKATFGCSTVIVDTNLTGDFQMPLLRTGQDYATWLMLIKRVDKALHFPQTLTSYRITPGSISRNKFKKAKRQWQIYRQQEHLNLYNALINFLFYAYRAVFRR